jgi:hypothetical protein
MLMMARRAFVALLVVLAAAAVPVAASASPPETETTVVKDTETFVDVAPSCEGGGPLYEITIDYVLVEHSTVSDTGEHFTFTQTGTFEAVALDPSEPDASGRFTVWGGFNANPSGAVNGTFTFNVRGQFEDGTRINVHLFDHFNETPTGGSFFFTHCHD